MSLPQAVALYARISSDPKGTELGVNRQVKDCRGLADSLGWVVAEEYVDNDVSAYKRGPRPAFQRLLEDIEAGRVDGVIVWHIDRLARQPIDLYTFMSAVRDAKINGHVRFVTGPSDIKSADGEFVAELMTLVGKKESADKSRRVLRKMQERAEQGLPHGMGGHRPYGYTKDGMHLVEEEAAVVRDLAARLLAGESALSLARWLNDQEVPSVSGAAWRTGTVRSILTSARIAGLREHVGEVYPAQWPQIITIEEHHRIRAAYAAKKNSGRRTPQRYLLSGLLRCGRCGNRLFSSARREGTSMGPGKNGQPRTLAKSTRRYVCSSSPDHGGCGRMTVVAEPVERLLADAVLHRLDTPELAEAMAGKNSEDLYVHELAQTIETTTAQLNELADLYATRQITTREWMRVRRTVQDEREAAQRRLAARTHNDALAGLPGTGEELRTSWSDLALGQQVAIISAVIDHATIAPGQPGARSFDPNRVDVTWRV